MTHPKMILTKMTLTTLTKNWCVKMYFFNEKVPNLRKTSYLCSYVLQIDG